MAHDVLKNCNKFVIQRIINPCVFWMTEYDDEKCYKNNLKELECLLARSVHEVKENDDVHIGMIIAVKYKTDFRRGVIADIFNRNAEITYSITLMDYNKTIEATKKSVYFINNKKQRIGQFSALEVNICDIQPITWDVDYEKNFKTGVFQERLGTTWSPGALEFVKQLVKKNPCVYVKTLCRSGRKILGEIYFVQNFDKETISLGQLLCDKGFAKLSSTEIKLRDDMPDRNNTVIEGKIPKTALLNNGQESQATKSVTGVCKDKNEMGNMTESMQRVPNLQSRSSNLHSTQPEFGSQNLKCNSSPKSSQNSDSSSWMLRKCLQLYALTPSNDSLKKQTPWES